MFRRRVTLVLPVNETRGIRSSFAMALPISAPPQTHVKMAPGSLFFSSTSAMIFVVANVTSVVVGAPFLIINTTIPLLLLLPKQYPCVLLTMNVSFTIAIIQPTRLPRSSETAKLLECQCSFSCISMQHATCNIYTNPTSI